MSELDFSIEPEVEALIREIAKDPRSSFFQVERPRSPRGLIQSWQPYSPSSAGWTAAERHLMSAYREEVAYCLRWKILLEGARLRPVPIFIDHRRSVDDRSELPSESELRRRAADTLRAAELDGSMPESGLAAGLMADRPLERSELYDLSILSLGLAPNDVAWLRVSWTLCIQNDPRTSVQVLGERLRTSGSDLMLSYMWENIGAAYSLLNDHPSAKNAYDRACSTGPLRVAPLASLLYQSLLSGDRRKVESVCRQIDEQVEPGHPALESFLHGLRQARAAGLWAPSSEALELTARLESSHGPSTRSIAHAAL